jgi:protein MpaA
MKLAALVSLLAFLVVVAPVSARTVLLGRSWQGRPIRAVEVGNPSGTRVLVVGCIHGNETAGIAIADALARLAPRDLDLWIVPDLNPDGVAAGTRQNAQGVDLNRNFPWHWRPLSGVYASGPHPLSEREARIAHALILRLHPHLTIWFHQHLDVVWASGGHRRIEKVFARVSGLPYHPMPKRPAAPSPGRTTPSTARRPSPPSSQRDNRTRTRSPVTSARCSRPHARHEQAER